MQRMTDAQRELAERNLPLVTWCLQNRITGWKPDEYEDLFQIGALALCKAAMRFDESAGVRFGTYAAECIVGDVRNAGRWARAKKRTMNMARLEDVAGREMDDVTLAETIADREDGRSMERMLILKETMNRIDGRDRRVLYMAVQGFGQVEIGRRLGMAQASVHRILRRSRQLIADEYAR